MFWLVNSYGHAREHLAQLQLTKQLFDETHQNDPPNDRTLESRMS